ncbi:MAG TPA: class I SAM-dependent methyltransferase [Conexivisphaerales archaeon]|nr:class I SAM-dependent methyltransferase [Conexivisphaerales archaeon]
MSVHRLDEPFPAARSYLLNNPLRRRSEPPSRLLDMLGVKGTDTLVDFGCGPGYYTMEAARRARLVIAVDISEEMLDKVKEAASKAGVSNVRCVRSDGRELKLEGGTADLVLLVRVYHEIAEHDAALKEFGRVLKVGGRLAMVERVKKGLMPGPPVQDPEALRSEVESSGPFRLALKLPLGSYAVLVFERNA